MYSLSEFADKDIEKLLEQSIINFGIEQTEIYFKSLKSCLDLLAENPAMGVIADDINSNYRRFIHQSHVIFYRERNLEILIIRILHQSMDIKNQFD